MEGQLAELSAAAKREQICSVVQRSTSLDSMPPPSNVSTLQYLNNGSSALKNDDHLAPAQLSAPPMLQTYPSMHPGPPPCPVQRSRSLPLLDQGALNTEEILAELAHRTNPGGSLQSVSEGIELRVDQMAHQDGSHNGGDDSGSNQDLNSVGSMQQHDYSTGPSTPTTPHHLSDPQMQHIHMNHQDLSPPPHSAGPLSGQPLNLSQNMDAKFFSQSFPANLLGNLRPNQVRDYQSQQQGLPPNWNSGLPDTRFPFIRNTETVGTYPAALSLPGLTQGRNSPFTSYPFLRESDKPPALPPDMYNTIGIPQGLHFSRSLMQLQQAPLVRGNPLVRDMDPTIDGPDAVRTATSLAGEPAENNNILKTTTTSLQQALNEAVDRYPLPVSLAMSLSDSAGGSPLNPGLKSNSPALRLKPMTDHMLSSMINNYSEDQLLSASGQLMSNSPVIMDENFLTGDMNSGGVMARLHEAQNIAVDNQSPTVSNEPAFDLLAGGENVEDTNFLPQGMSPQPPPLGMDQQEDAGGMMNYQSQPGDEEEQRMGTLRGNNNQQLSGSSPGDGPSKPKKGRPRAGTPGHRYSQPCPTCGKVFGSSSALAKHKLIHSSERRHKCILCAKSFKRQDHLTGHMLTHRSRKPYECTVDNCNKSYCDIRSLRRHFESQHPGLVMEDNMNYTGDEKDPELMRAEAAARQAQTFPTSVSPNSVSGDYIMSYASASPPSSVAAGVHANQEVDSAPGSSSSQALQYLAQAAQRANSNTLSTLASVAEEHNLALNSQEHQQHHQHDLNNSSPPTSYPGSGGEIPGHFLSASSPQSLHAVMSSIPSGSSGLTITIPPPRDISTGPHSLGGYHHADLMSSAASPQKNTIKVPRPEKERAMVKCSICQKTFKSMPALNGHMRLHGGYNSTRSNTPPSNHPDPGKRPTAKPPNSMTQVPSSYSPQNTMDFTSGGGTGYPHHIMVPQHTMGMPSSQPPPNMVSLMGRYPTPENNYRPAVIPRPQQVIGGNIPPQLPMGPHHLLQQPPALIQARPLDYIPRQQPSYPTLTGLSSLSQVAASIKVEVDANGPVIPLPEPVGMALNLSAPRKPIPTPSPPELEAEQKYSEGLRQVVEHQQPIDGQVPLMYPQHLFQPPLLPAAGKEIGVFRDPTPVQVSPTKRKPRPPSLIIPAWATTMNPGGIPPSAFHSQMRSPREIGAAGFMYRPATSTTPPPYTPPPMLSPIRSGSGLYFSASATSVGNRVATPAQTPTTPSMLQFHRRASTGGPQEEQSELVFSSEPHINVGPEFQAAIPEMEKEPCPTDECDEREGTLLWSRDTNKLYPEVEVHYFLDLACTPTLPGGARNTEFAYHCLQHANGDIEIALMMLLNQKPLLPKNISVNGYKYDFTAPWTQNERKAFRDMYKAKGKDFHEIQKGIPTKMVKDCVEYYYYWKKLYPYNADMQKFCHHSGLNPNEEMRRQECDLYPDETFMDYVPLKEYRSDKYGRVIEDRPSKPPPPKATTESKGSAKSDGPYLCSFTNCTASFKSRQALNGHIRVHGGLSNKAKQKPRIPSAASDSSGDEEQEMEQELAEPPERMEHSSADDVSSSEMSEDDDNILHPCKICGEEFTKIKSRSAHMKTHRTNDPSEPSQMLVDQAVGMYGGNMRPGFSSSLSEGDGYNNTWETESSNMEEESLSSEGDVSD